MALLSVISICGIIVDTGQTPVRWFETIFVIVALSSVGALATTIRIISEVISAMLYAIDPPSEPPGGVAAGLDEIEAQVLPNSEQASSSDAGG